jgi:hypothetical protein
MQSDLFALIGNFIIEQYVLKPKQIPNFCTGYIASMCGDGANDCGALKVNYYFILFCRKTKVYEIFKNVVTFFQ